MNHLDLFSGIGGFALAASWVWGPDHHVVSFCEIDPFCRKVLNKHWPDAPICTDIKTFHYFVDENDGNGNNEKCEILNNNKQTVEILNSLNLPSEQRELFSSANFAGLKNQCRPVSPIEEMDGNIAHGLAVQKQCEATMAPILGEAHGCEAKETQNIKMEEGMIGTIDTMKTKLINGVGAFSQETIIRVKNVDMSLEKQTPLMPTMSSTGKIIQKEDLTLRTELPCVNHATKRNINEPIDLLTAGTPCQPASVAGKRKGTSDDRWLWGETFRVIKEAKPRWVILENVRGLLSLEGGVVFENLLLELEALGYEVSTFIIPACAVNAPHRRDRVWIVAHRINERLFGRGSGSDTDSNGIQEGEQAGCQPRGTAPRCDEASFNASHAPNRQDNERIGESLAETEGCRERVNPAIGFGDQYACDSTGERLFPGTLSGIRGGKEITGARDEESSGRNILTSDPGNERLQGGQRPGTHDERPAPHGSVAECHSAWDEPWIEAASRLCKLYDGLPDRLVRYSLTYPETHHIMGFILTLRRYHYGTSEEKRTKEILPFLRGAFAEESVQRCFGRLSEVFKEENLQCAVHGKDDGKRKENEVCVSESSFKIQEEPLQELRHNRKPIRSSQRRELEKQCSCEFDDIVCELSHEIALGEWKRNTETAHNVLFDMWQESRGERFLHEPLSALHEIWKSVTNKEVGSFRRHLNFRDKDRTHRLKALGNAIVPQVAYEIMKAIVLVDDL